MSLFPLFVYFFLTSNCFGAIFCFFATLNQSFVTSHQRSTYRCVITTTVLAARTYNRRKRAAHLLSSTWTYVAIKLRALVGWDATAILAK